MFSGDGWGDDGDYDNVAVSVIVCVWELIAVMQAAALRPMITERSKSEMAPFSLTFHQNIILSRPTSQPASRR